MKFSVGDNILLKRTNEEGRIIAILSPTMMEVEVHGITFPVYTDEIDHPYLKWFTEKKKPVPKLVSEVPTERIKERPKRQPQGIFLAFIPVFLPNVMEDIVTDVRIHLINETNEPIHFAYVVKTAQDKQTLFTHTGVLHAFGNLYLHALSLEVMNEQPRFNWFIGAEAINNAQPDFQTLRIKPAKLFEKFQNLLINGESSFSYLLVETANELAIKAQKPLTTIPAIGLRATNEPAYIGKHSLPLATDVVDLHIEQLTEKHEEMSLAEMLLLQIQMLEYEISLNIAHNMKRMIVIHGVGNGRLKNAIHEYLATLKEVRSFHNSWMALYGYGATEVFLK